MTGPEVPGLESPSCGGGENAARAAVGVHRKACIGVSYCTALMRGKNNDLGQFPAGGVPRDPLYADDFKLAAGR